jgi:hypothetical protein
MCGIIVKNTNEVSRFGQDQSEERARNEYEGSVSARIRGDCHSVEELITQSRIQNFRREKWIDL